MIYNGPRPSANSKSFFLAASAQIMLKSNFLSAKMNQRHDDLRLS